MSLIQIEWHPSNRQLRTFGLSGLVASVVAAFLLHRLWGVTLPGSATVVALGVALFLCSLLAPKVTRILYLGLTIPALPIGLVVSFLVLAAFYFLVITPLAIVFRLMGRDPLHRRFDPAAASYWVPHKPTEETERYLHQF